MRRALIVWLAVVAFVHADAPEDVFKNGEAISLDAIPANERGVVALAADDRGRIFAGTSGRAAHLLVHDPATGVLRSLLNVPGGVGLTFVRLPDGSLVAGTHPDQTGVAVSTDAKAVGRLYRVTVNGEAFRIEDIGVAIAGQGVYALAHLEKSGKVVGNTWPDGHFFSLDLKTNKVTDHGVIAGYRTFETPFYAEHINKSGGRRVNYPRQVSRAIAVVGSEAYTAGANGQLYRYSGETGKLEKIDWKLPAAQGRESWTSLDAVAVTTRRGKPDEGYTSFVGGTSDGHLFEVRLEGRTQLRPRGKMFAQPGIQGLALIEEKGIEKKFQTVFGLSGRLGDLPRGFAFRQGGMMAAMIAGGIPRVDGELSMSGFGAICLDGKGSLWAGESDRIGRLVRFPLDGKAKPRQGRKPVDGPKDGPEFKNIKSIEGTAVFAPPGTTTEASGYTAIEVGKDEQVYVGSARYGDYAWLLRFDPARKPLWMEKVVSMRELTGERREGINTQGKIHAKILVGADGKVWFASKQAHEVFDTRPEFEDPDGYPGGHLCWFDPKTGFSRSTGILKPREGLMAGAIDDARGKLYYRSEPRNHFLVYDIKTGEVRDRGHVGNIGRYMALDDKGFVWMVGRGKTLCRYNPETDYVDNLAIEVKGEGDYETPYILHRGPNGKLHGIGTAHPWVMEFTPTRHSVLMRNITPAAPAGMPVLDIHSAVFGKDGKLYYPLVTSQADPKKRGERFLLIMRFDPETSKTEIVGKPNVIVDKEKVKHAYVRGEKYEFDHTQGAAIGADGSLYIMDIYPQLNVVCFPKLTAPR